MYNNNQSTCCPKISIEKIKVGSLIKEFRKMRGISQMSLDLDIDTAPGSISRIETGRVEPRKETIIRIASALGLNLKELVSLFGIEIE